MALVIGFYSRTVAKSLNRRFDDIEGNEALDFDLVLPLYLGGDYFVLREVIQVISLVSLKVFKLWLYDPSNYLMSHLWQSYGAGRSPCIREVVFATRSGWGLQFQ